MYVVYINLLYFLSIFLYTYNKNLLSQKKKILLNGKKSSLHNVIPEKDKRHDSKLKERLTILVQVTTLY